MKDSLLYYWRSHLAVVLGTAVATAVLTGALLVGDSMRGSLRAMALDRLGDVDHALLGEGFFREELADETGGVPLVLLRGAAVAPASERRASEVNVVGIDGGFVGLYPGVDAASFDLDRAEGQFFPSVVINEALQRELGVAVGDQVLLRLGRPSDVPRETLMGSTEVSDVVETLRVAVRAVIPDRGPGRFGLALQQSVQRNAFVALPDLQRAIDQEGRVNAALYEADAGDPRNQAEAPAGSGRAPSRPRGAGRENVELGPPSRDESEALSGQREERVRERLQLDDLGLSAEERGGVLAVRSREILLRPALEAAIRAFATAERLPEVRVSTYLANMTRPAAPATGGSASPSPVEVEAGERYLPYSTITALAFPLHAGAGTLTVQGGAPAPVPGDGEVLVNAWAARDLGVSAGENVTVSYWEVGAREELVARERTLRVAGVVDLVGLGADRTLAPDFPGVADAEDMSDWDPTFPVDLGLIRDRDEEYWDRFGAAPKLFVSEELGRQLWGSERFGALTEIRLVLPAAAGSSAPSGETPQAGDAETGDAETGDAVAVATRLRDQLATSLPLRAAGLSVVPLRVEALAAGQGATDFAGLFVGFSLFLIVAAILLVALFFRLGIERRAREIGLRLSIGEGARAVKRGHLLEGALLAGLGVLLGSLLAAGYAQAMIVGLRTLWSSAISGAELQLFVRPASLAIGALGALVVVMLTIARSVRQLARRPVVGLLRGDTGTADEPRSGRRSRWVLVGSLLVGGALFAASFAVEATRAAPLFFGLGAALLVAGLSAFVWLLARRASAAQGGSSLEKRRWSRIAAQAVANLTLHPGRSLLSVSLVAAATFVIVAVGAYGHDFRSHDRDRDSGTGGFQLVAQSDIALFHDLGTAEGRSELGFDEDDGEPIAASTVVPFRLLPGDDVSCLNLYRPQQPRLLGVPPELVERGGFRFQQTQAPEGDAVESTPWELLEQDLGPGVVPAIGDYNSVLWILHQRLGGEITVEDETGQPLRLRLVGLLRKSVFQSELLISERAFARHFPSQAGYRYFLVETPPGRETEVASALESGLEDFGFDSELAAERLQSFQAVENTYLATFQTLGGLGLLLGTFGLAVILVRNVLERLGELATLRAIGYRRATLGWIVFAENAILLAVGLALGTGSALVAVTPHLASGGALVPWPTLAATLLGVATVGLAASAAAVRRVLRAPLLPALRAD